MKIKDFFRGKHVFVTGHTGFKGGWLCHVLKSFGAEVTGFSQEPEAKSFFNSCHTQEIVNHNIGDINNHQNLENTMLLSEPDIIIHMAAQPLVRLSYETPLETFQTNIIGTANVLMAALGQEKRPLTAVVTSDKCYENTESIVPYKESDRLGGHDPYSASKGAAELLTASIAKSFYLKNKQSILSLRGGNVIGGGDWAKDRIMTDIIKALEEKRAPIIRSPQSIRPWQHILDVLSGYLTAIMHVSQQPLGSFDQFNIGPVATNEATVATLSKLVCDYWGHGIKPEMSQAQDGFHEAKLLKLDISKAIKNLEWLPKYDFEKTVKKTVDWYKAESNGENMMSFTDKQIFDYFAKGLNYG